jgi:predicted 2-oxoglutarate/Fe(II)-dependent dioxygenase YbiX
MPPPRTLAGLGGFVQQDFLARTERRALARRMRRADGDPAEVFAGDTVRVDRGTRHATELAAPAALAADLDGRVAALGPALSRHFDRAVGVAESVSLLRYGPGGYYRPHRDRGARSGTARTVSVVIFVNDGRSEPGFAGGALRFYGVLGEGMPEVGVDIEPEAGTLIAFPSEWLHEVAPVATGERYTVVTWFGGAAG